MQYVVGPELARYDDGQAPSCKLVDHGEHAKAPPVLGAVLHEVVGPHVIGPFRPQPDARAVVQPQTPTLGLFVRDFQPLPPPDAVDPLHAHVPAFVEEQAADAPVAVAAIPGRQPYDPRLRGLRQLRLRCRGAAVGSSWGATTVSAPRGCLTMPSASHRSALIAFSEISDRRGYFVHRACAFERC